MVTEAIDAGWERLNNGELLKAAETAGFEVIVTGDRSIRYQQNLAGRKIAVVVLPSGRWPLVEPQVDEVMAAIDAATPGSYSEIPLRASKPSGPSSS